MAVTFSTCYLKTQKEVPTFSNLDSRASFGPLTLKETQLKNSVLALTIGLIFFSPLEYIIFAIRAMNASSFYGCGAIASHRSQPFSIYFFVK